MGTFAEDMPITSTFYSQTAADNYIKTHVVANNIPADEPEINGTNIKAVFDAWVAGTTDTATLAQVSGLSFSQVEMLVKEFETRLATLTAEDTESEE